MAWTGFSRAGAQKLIDRFKSLGILEIVDEKSEYDRKYKYKISMHFKVNFERHKTPRFGTIANQAANLKKW